MSPESPWPALRDELCAIVVDVIWLARADEAITQQQTERLARLLEEIRNVEDHDA